MPNKKKVLLLATLVLLAAPYLAAFEIGDSGLSFYITNDFLFQSNRLAEDKSQFYETLTLFANYGKWSAGVTLRTNNFYKQTPNLSLEQTRFDFYRKYIQYNSKYWDVTAGDFYALLGRGLVLSVLKNDAILRERTILGGNIHYNKGRLDMRVLGGRIKDETFSQEWNMIGGEVSLEYMKNHSAGVHFSYIDDVDSRRQLGKRLTYSLSLKGNKLLKYFGYYAEAAFLDFEAGNRVNGHAFFTGLTFSKSHIIAALEFKRYKNFDNEMNNPPIADREDEISSINETTGVRLNLQYAFWEPDIILFINFGRYEEYQETGNHIYGGIIAEDLMDRLSFSASYGIRDIHYPIKRIDTHLVYQFTELWSTELSFKDRRYSDGLFTFREIDHTFQVSYSPYVSVFAMHQYSHNKIIGLNHFYSVGIKVFLKGGTSMELSGGTIRGGQICSGGQCYVAPPFKGLKFALLHTFK